MNESMLVGFIGGAIASVIVIIISGLLTGPINDLYPLLLCTLCYSTYTAICEKLDDVFGTTNKVWNIAANSLLSGALIFIAIALIQGFIFIRETLNVVGVIAGFLILLCWGYQFSDLIAQKRWKAYALVLASSFGTMLFLTGALRSIATVTREVTGVWILTSLVIGTIGSFVDFKKPNG